MARARAERLAETVGILEGMYGKIPVVGDSSLLDLLVSLLLTRVGSNEAAAEARRLLSEHFVDWNEVRLSWRREVAGAIRPAGFPDPLEAAGEVIDFLNRLYMVRNAANLDFLREMEPDQAYAALRSLDGIDEGIAAAVAARAIGKDKALTVPEVLRPPGRVGIAGRDATPAKTRRVIEQADEEMRIRAHFYYARHAETLCTSRNPECERCDLLPICDYGKAFLKKSGGKKDLPAEDTAGKDVAATAGGDGPGVEKAPPKKTTAKKATAKKATAKKATPKKTTPKKTTPKKATPKKATPKKATPKKKAPTKKKAPKKPTAKKATAKKATAKKATAKKATAKKAPAKKKVPTKKAAPAKRAAAKKKASDKAGSGKTTAKKAAGKIARNKTST